MKSHKKTDMKWTVTKAFTFEAAHSLPHLPLGHKCRNLHGHSYRVVVGCSKWALDERGFVIDYAELSAALDPIIARLDHQNLNEILPFKTTAENLAAWLYNKLSPELPVDFVEFYETAKTCVRVERK